jgi:hypothetical protein
MGGFWRAIGGSYLERSFGGCLGNVSIRSPADWQL